MSHPTFPHNGSFASEYDSHLFDLAQIILLRVNAGRATRHEALYQAIDNLTPEHLEAAERLCAELRRLKQNPPARLVPAAELAKVFHTLDSMAEQNHREAAQLAKLARIGGVR